MKTFLKIVLYVNIAVFLYGFYLQYFTHNTLYTRLIGGGVLLLVFVLLPLFLYYRYKDKSIEDYRFKGFNKESEER